MRLVILANATRVSGAGHVMRCAALAAAWKRRGFGDVIVAGDIEIPFVKARLDSVGVRVEGHPPRAAGDVVIVDSYEPLVRAHGAAMRDAALRVFVDDLAEPVPSGFDAVWNPNGCSVDSWYRAFTGAVVTGADTVPLRDDLPSWDSGNAVGIGLALGGSTPAPILIDALVGLAQRLQQKVVAAGGWPDAPSSWRHAAPDQPWSELARCRVVLAVASATFWEASAVGVPVVVLQTQPNQRLVFDYAKARGLAAVDVMDEGDSLALEGTLAAAIADARPAPRITNGAGRVADTLHRLACHAR